ncbi:hypothetical protein, partial [Acetobacter oeni]|uniref:hypothetical protein n=1 Tax=Acetobacter oeni TaxID=304077 RepID=UPI001C9996BA
MTVLPGWVSMIATNTRTGRGGFLAVIRNKRFLYPYVMSWHSTAEPLLSFRATAQSPLWLSVCEAGGLMRGKTDGQMLLYQLQKIRLFWRFVLCLYAIL